MSTPTTLERRLDAPARGCRVTTAVRQHGAAAYELGDLHGLALWLQARARLARLSPVELQELRALARVLVRQASPIRRSLEQQLQAAAEQQVPASLSWEERQQLLVQREAQRRAGGMPLAGSSLTKMPKALPAPRGRGRHKGAQPIGECGARLARKIDRLLAEVRTTDPTDTDAGAEVLAAAAPEPAMAESAPAELQPLAAPEAMAPQIGDRREPGPEPTTTVAAGDLADALVIAGSSAPEAPSAAAALQPLAESATADLHEQVLVAAAQAGLEQEPAEPLPVSIHAVEAAKELIPAAPT